VVYTASLGKLTDDERQALLDAFKLTLLAHADLRANLSLGKAETFTLPCSNRTAPTPNQTVFP
jgi:hypothetical protein